MARAAARGTVRWVPRWRASLSGVRIDRKIAIFGIFDVFVNVDHGGFGWVGGLHNLSYCMYSTLYAGLETCAEVVVAACVGGAISNGQEDAFCHESAIDFANPQRAYAGLFV